MNIAYTYPNINRYEAIIRICTQTTDVKLNRLWRVPSLIVSNRRRILVGNEMSITQM